MGSPAEDELADTCRTAEICGTEPQALRLRVTSSQLLLCRDQGEDFIDFILCLHFRDLSAAAESFGVLAMLHSLAIAWAIWPGLSVPFRFPPVSLAHESALETLALISRSKHSHPWIHHPVLSKSNGIFSLVKTFHARLTPVKAYY